MNHLIGKLHFVLQIEPENSWFQKALKEVEQRLESLL